MRASFLALVFLALSLPLGGQQALNNKSVIELVKAHLSEDLIVSTINAAPGSYDTTAQGLIALKTAGASDKVISAILLKSTGAAPAAQGGFGAALMTDSSGLPVLAALPQGVDSVGIYYLDTNGAWQEVSAEVVNFRTGGVLKHYASAGIVKGDTNGSIAGTRSRLSLRLPASFILYVPEGTSPGEYQLLRLSVEKDSREFRSFTGGVVHESGGATQNRTEFTSRKIAPHAYQVTLSGETGRGEFGFLPPSDAGSGKGMASSGKIYTFSLGQ